MSNDWENRGGTVTAGMQLTPMDMNVEHKFELIEVKFKPQVTTKYGVKDKIQFVWKESGKEKDFHRIWTEFNESYSEKSSLIEFMRQASPKPILENTPIKLGEIMCIGMQIRALVQARFDNITKQPSGFYDFITASIKPASVPQTTLTPSKPDATLANALLLAKGAKDHNEAMDKLNAAGASKELAMALFNANLDGLVKYPI